VRTVWLDGDVLVYRAGYAAEHTFYTISFSFEGTTVSRRFDNKSAAVEFLDDIGLDPTSVMWEVSVETEPEENALFNVRSMIRRVLEACGSDEDHLQVILSGPTNFRFGVAKTVGYKANRDEKKKPVHAPALKAYLRRRYNVLTSVDEEADDVMAYNHYSLWVRDPDSTVIATIDKDLNMVPGWHYNFATDVMRDINEAEAMTVFWKQMLTGDATDNIKGVRGIGPVTAEKAMAACNTEAERQAMVWAYYSDAFGQAAASRLLENGRLLWMRRQPNEWWQVPPSIQEQIDNAVHQPAGSDDDIAAGLPENVGGTELPVDGGLPRVSGEQAATPV